MSYGLAEAGADPEVLRQVISVSSGNSALFEARVRDFLLKDSFEPGFLLDLKKKDVGIGVTMGKARMFPYPLVLWPNRRMRQRAAWAQGNRIFQPSAKSLKP